MLPRSNVMMTWTGGCHLFSLSFRSNYFLQAKLKVLRLFNSQKKYSILFPYTILLIKLFYFFFGLVAASAANGSCLVVPVTLCQCSHPRQRRELDVSHLRRVAYQHMRIIINVCDLKCSWNKNDRGVHFSYSGTFRLQPQPQPC
jgi:hypothetical protein